MYHFHKANGLYFYQYVYSSNYLTFLYGVCKRPKTMTALVSQTPHRVRNLTFLILTRLATMELNKLTSIIVRQITRIITIRYGVEINPFFCEACSSKSQWFLYHHQSSNLCQYLRPALICVPSRFRKVWSSSSVYWS